jgi:hypothetical protein
MNGLNRLDQPTINGLQSLELDSLTTTTINSDLLRITNVEGNTVTVDNQLILLSGSSVLAAGLEIQPSEISYLDGCTQNIEARFVADETLIGTNTSGISALNTTVSTMNTTVSSHETRLDADEIVINDLVTTMGTVTPLISKCQYMSAGSGFTTFNGSTKVHSTYYMLDNSVQTTAFSGFYESTVNSQISQISVLQSKCQLITSTPTVTNVTGNLSADVLITRGTINFPDGTTQASAYQPNGRASMNYTHSSNYIWGLGSSLNYNSVYNTSNIFLSSNISNNTCLTGGKFHKPGRYMITFCAQITNLKWFTTLISRIMIVDQPSTVTRYQIISSGRNLGAGNQVSAEDTIYYSVQAICDVTTALDTSFGIYNEFNFASSISGTRTALKGEILVYEL